MVQILETPRDAMQGIKRFIPTEQKTEYINSLLKVGFDIIDFGSFVSPKAIPQLRDTAEVVQNLDLTNSSTRLLSIIGNVRGANDASQFDQISYLGYPHSISNSFLERNLNSSLFKSRAVLAEILNISDKFSKSTLVYLSMAFGNPYNEEWQADQLFNECLELEEMGVEEITLADTTGVSTPAQVGDAFNMLTQQFPNIKFGLHLHTCIDCWHDKIDAAYKNGCARFDGVINGLGGCPMTGYELVGNLKTCNIMEYLNNNKIPHNINMARFEEARELARMTMEEVSIG